MATVREDVVKLGFDVDWGELKSLQDALDDTKAAVTGDFGADAFDELIKDSKKATEGVDQFKKSVGGVNPKGVNDTNDGLQQTQKETQKATDKMKKFANQSFDKLTSGLKSVVSTMGKVGLAAGKMLLKGIAVSAAGIGALVTNSVMSYGDYEQLVGGVDTLFKDMSGTVQYYASEAWKTAGISENKYMETATSFSASLIQALNGDTAKAATITHTAITDMSDNANKMGTDMETLIGTYQSLARGNYAMLDNLKLGYGGTKEELNRLLADAQKLTGQKYDISSFADVIEAIHVIQDSMGITGTTAKEASETISGSFGAMKAAWANTLTALILGGDDFDRCIDNLIESAKTFGKNIMPAIRSALEGVGKMITALAPTLERELPGIIKTLLPPLLKAATSLVKGLIVALPDIVKTIASELPTILSELWSAIKEAFGDVPGLEKAETFFKTVKTWCTDNAEIIKNLIPAVLGLVAAFTIFNKLKGLTGLFGGGSGGAGGGFFSGLASMNTGNVLKGLGNLAIIVGGLALLAAALMYAAPYMAQLSDLKSIGEVLLVTGAVGLLGTAMTKLAASVGNIPVATVAKGLANVAIVMVGFGALAAVLMWAAPYMAQLSDVSTTTKILLIIGATGLVGSALAGLAGLVGAIPITVVLAGLANIALALGGFSAIAVAFGALQKVDGFTELLNSGGEVLTNLCNILGQMVGSIIGGIGEGATASLPAIGGNLSAFAASLQPMFTVLSGVDSTGVTEFAGAFGALIGALAAEKLTSFFTGGVDYAGIGSNLNTMATGLSGFFSTITTFPDGGFEKATALFECLAGLKSLPEDGGVVGWFMGEINFAKIATGLTTLAGAAGAFSAIQTIPEEAFSKMSSLFDCLGGLKALPNDGGVVGWFMGEINFDKIVSGIQTLASEGLISALTTISTIPENGFTSISTLFETLAGIKAMPKEGGIAGWFAGDSTTGLTNVASQLPVVATHIASFFTNLGGITDFSPIKSLFDTLSAIEIDSDAADKGFLGLGKSDLETIGEGLSSFANEAKTFFDTVNALDTSKMTSFLDGLGTANELPETLSTLDSSVGTSLSNLVTTADTKLAELKSAFSDELGAIAVIMNTTAVSMYSSGQAIMQGVNNGMNSMRGRLISTARSMAAAIQSAFNVRLDINSPSGEGIKQGAFYGEGIDLGMQSKIPDLQNTATKMGSTAISYASRYTPNSDSTTVYNSRTSSEYTTIAPAFNLTISGTQDDRATARKVKRWVNDAVTEIFESMERKSYVTS